MSEIEESLRTYLLTQSGLTALIVNRVMPDEYTAGVTLPAVTYQKISDVKDHLLTGQSTVERPVFQYTTYARSRAVARSVTNQLKTALCDYSGTLSGIVVQKIELQNEMSGIETDGVSRVYTEDLEFQVTFERS